MEAAQTQGAPIHTGVLAIGYAFAALTILVPLLAVGGVVIGVVVAAKGSVGHGVAMIALSTWLGIVGYVLWTTSYAV